MADAPLPQGLPARLKALRLRAGLSAFALAKLARTTAQTVHAVERGESQPRVGLARRLADALGASLDELCGPEPVWPEDIP